MKRIPNPNSAAPSSPHRPTRPRRRWLRRTRALSGRSAAASGGARASDTKATATPTAAVLITAPPLLRAPAAGPIYPPIYTARDKLSSRRGSHHAEGEQLLSGQGRVGSKTYRGSGGAGGGAQGWDGGESTSGAVKWNFAKCS
jgi:hypothetical protein